MAMGFFLCLGYLTAGVEIFDFRFCGRANVVVISLLPVKIYVSSYWCRGWKWPIGLFTPGATNGRVVRVFAYKLVQMKAGHVGFAVLCGGPMKQRIQGRSVFFSCRFFLGQLGLFIWSVFFSYMLAGFSKADFFLDTDRSVLARKENR